MNVKIGTGKKVHITGVAYTADSAREQTLCGKTLEKAVEVESEATCWICAGWSSR